MGSQAISSVCAPVGEWPGGGGYENLLLLGLEDSRTEGRAWLKDPVWGEREGLQVWEHTHLREAGLGTMASV